MKNYQLHVRILNVSVTWRCQCVCVLCVCVHTSCTHLLLNPRALLVRSAVVAQAQSTPHEAEATSSVQSTGHHEPSTDASRPSPTQKPLPLLGPRRPQQPRSSMPTASLVHALEKENVHGLVTEVNREKHQIVRGVSDADTKVTAGDAVPCSLRVECVEVLLHLGGNVLCVCVINNPRCGEYGGCDDGAMRGQKRAPRPREDSSVSDVDNSR